MGKAWPHWRCPEHRVALRSEAESLFCPAGERYPLRDGIPRFVASSSYSASFGLQWNRYRLTQLDSHAGIPITRERIRHCLGEDLYYGLHGLHVLECGCGAGRFTEILLDRGASVTSIDLSEAVDVNRENFPEADTHRIAQADVLKLPFAPRLFDVVFCLGVVQHTPNPEETIRRLYDQVRPGGALVLDHYTYNLSWYTKSAMLFREYLRRLPPDLGLRHTEKLVELFLPLHRTARHSRLGQMLLSRISPVLCYYQAYPQLSDELQREWALVDTHDYLTDWYKHFRTPRQMIGTFERMGLTDVWCTAGGNGVEIRGKRPAADRS
jgi:2-polyprenyl-3-methyl-5-hydroxy-6-metoxy-1,4-benzoquinol methylase